MDVLEEFIKSQPDIQISEKYDHATVLQLLQRLDAIKSQSYLTFYAVQLPDGRFFKSKGFYYNNSIGEHDRSWVDDIKKAKLYSKPGPAKSIVTFLNRRWPQLGALHIIELHVTTINVFDPLKVKKKKSDKLQNAKSTDEFFKIKI